MGSWVSSWLCNPPLYGVIVGREAADRIQRSAVPHIFRVEPRPDPLHDLADVVGVERGGWREAAEILRGAHRVNTGVVVAAHVHPQLIVAPPPQRDVLLRHDV